MNTSKRIFTLAMAAAILGVCAMLLCDAALAQSPGPGRGRGLPEKNEKAWELQAKTVAETLALSPEQTAKLVTAYKAARESHRTALREKMGQNERPDFRAMMDVNKAERAKLETALNAFLKPDQTAKALATLGSFSRRWDPMVAALDAMGLDEKTKSAAMKLVAGHVAEAAKTMQPSGPGGDFRAMREQAGKMKEKLDADMAKILSPEQMTKWKESTAMPAGQRRGRGPQGPEPKPAAK